MKYRSNKTLGISVIYSPISPSWKHPIRIILISYLLRVLLEVTTLECWASKYESAILLVFTSLAILTINQYNLSYKIEREGIIIFFIASYYRQLSAESKMKKSKIKTSLLALRGRRYYSNDFILIFVENCLWYDINMWFFSMAQNWF